MGILWVVVGIILLFWIGGLVLDVAGSLIHILLIVGLALLVYNLFVGRRSTR